MKNSFLIKLALVFFVGGILVALCGLALKNLPVGVVGVILAGHCSTVILVILYKRKPIVFEGLILSVLAALKFAFSCAVVGFIQLRGYSENDSSFLSTQSQANICQLILGCDIIFCFSLIRCGWRIAVHPGTQYSAS